MLVDDCAIVIDCNNVSRPSIGVLAKFGCGGCFEPDFVSNFVSVWSSFCIFSCIVLIDELLLLGSDVFPIGFKGSVGNGVAAKNKLTWGETSTE